MEWNSQTTIGQIVARNSRAAAVFSKYKIDFCCQGHRRLEEASQQAGVDPKVLIQQINNLPEEGIAPLDLQDWPIDLIADYVEKKHHRFVRTEGPVLAGLIQKIHRVHGAKHPELEEVEALFLDCLKEMQSHMDKEERILFPYIRQLAQSQENGSPLPSPPFGQVLHPITQMMAEHDGEGERFRRLAEITKDYQVPSDGCMTYLLAMKGLKQFQEDLHWHIHTENNILFPQAMEWENRLISESQGK